MKIAIITPYKNYHGGVEKVNYILKSIFEEDGNLVEFITSENCMKCSYFTKKIIGLPAVTAKKFKKISNNFDIVICNGEFGYGINHPKCINLFHGSYWGYRKNLNQYITFQAKIKLTRNAIIQKNASTTKNIITVSTYIKNILELQGISVSQCINNCIDTSLFKPLSIKNSRKKYLFVGNYNYWGKGFDILNHLAKQGLEIDCVTNENPGEELGWIKNCSYEKMPEIYNKYRMLVFPSRFEGMPLSTLEALACGVPIVTFNVGIGPDLKKIIPEFVIDDPKFQADQFICRINKINEDYANFSKKAINYVNEYHDFNMYKQKWLNLIRDINDR